MMNRNLLFAAVLWLLPFVANAQMSVRIGPDAPLRKLQIAEMAVKGLYVDSVNEEKLVEDAIRGMIEKLDPHSSYMTAKEVKNANESLQGNFEGIGVQFNMVEDTLLVIQPVTNGPSEKVGILAGDRIVKVNDTIIAGVKMAKEEIMRRLRGPKGTKVQMNIVRRGIADTLSFTVVRDKIPVHSIDAAYMVRPKVGYIRIGSFSATTHDEFCERLKALQKQGMKSLILDLQENGGGFLHAAVKIANEFLEKDDLIVYTEGRQAQRTEYKAQGGGLFTKGNVMVLVDSYTASAAEIVSGAIQDHDRGLVFGRRSFGKGLVQRPIDLPDGSMIRLTIAHYYTPSGRCIQKPYEKGNQRDYAMDVVNRLKSGELMSADSVHFADSLKYYTLKKHRLVYGGGGIMPDVFVPLDTTRTNQYYRNATAKNVVLNTSLQYTERNRRSIQRRFRTFDEFRDNYEVGPDVLRLFLDKAKTEQVEYDEAQYQECLPIFKTQIKATVARLIWGMDAYYQVIQELDETVQRAVVYMETGQ